MKGTLWRPLVLVGCIWSPFVSPDNTLVASRDPFRPLSTTPCRESVVAQWRLRGVLGDNRQWVGWLSTPQHNWFKVVVGDSVPDTAWRITRLNQHEMSLEKGGPLSGCQDKTSEWTLPAPGAEQRMMNNG